MDDPTKREDLAAFLAGKGPVGEMSHSDLYRARALAKDPATQRIEGSFTNEAVIQATPEMLRLAAQRLLAASATDVEVK